jgi:hypothetical protein
MKPLTIVKLIHTLIWIFFNGVIFYLLYAVITNRIGIYVWVGFALFALEGLVLLIFKNMCPLTLVARKYSASEKHNFDIYLPEWLAKYNKPVYTSILLIVIIIFIYRLITNP